MKFKPSSVLKYEAAFEGPSMGGSDPSARSKYVIPFGLKVLSVEKGTATIEYTLGPASVDGKPQGEAQKRVVKMDSQGRPVGGTGGLEFSGVGLPAKAVKIGQTWTSQPPSGATGAGGVKGTYKLVALRSMGGHQVAEIAATTSSAPDQGLSTSGVGKIFLRTADGSLHYAELTQTIRMGSGAQAQSTKSTIKITRKA
jgi:hypothetical protein